MPSMMAPSPSHFDSTKPLCASPYTIVEMIASYHHSLRPLTSDRVGARPSILSGLKAAKHHHGPFYGFLSHHWRRGEASHLSEARSHHRRPSSDECQHHPKTANEPQRLDLEAESQDEKAEKLNPMDPRSFPDAGLEAWLSVSGAFCCLFCWFSWIKGEHYARRSAYLRTVADLQQPLVYTRDSAYHQPVADRPFAGVSQTYYEKVPLFSQHCHLDTLS